jgi:hypothetical protein
MKETTAHTERIYKMLFSTVYPLYVAKIERKGRSTAELNHVIEWLTGYDSTAIEKLVQENTSFVDFFKNAQLNSKANLITGLICGYRIEEISDPLTKKVRYLDKLVDDLAKGKKIEKMLSFKNQ